MEKNTKLSVHPVKHHLLTLQVKGMDKESANQLREKQIVKLHRKLIDASCFSDYTPLENNCHQWSIFDFYFLKELGGFQKIRHYVREFFTTIFHYVGIHPDVVVIENNF